MIDRWALALQVSVFCHNQDKHDRSILDGKHMHDRSLQKDKVELNATKW